MLHWIENVAKKLREEGERREKTEQARYVAREALLSNSKPAFEKLLAAVEKDVEKFNTHFPEEQKRLRPPERIGDTGFQVLRQHCPAFILNVTLDKHDPVIHYDVRHPINNTVHGQLYSTAGFYNLRLEKDGIKLLKSGEIMPFEEASRELLLPAIESLTDFS